MRSEVYFTTLPPALAARFDAARKAKRIGAPRDGAAPTVSATLRALVSAGLDALDGPAPVGDVAMTSGVRL